ncbi:MAG TPA: crosslink repair DNA glycosylase YcaQ family protein, partial [Candidatus Saccharimonadales bacterium]|nr:crosslink repair DNA glycosylase YcaQ family protein [Candidatus Saccharimonadales bacterium]
MSAPSRSSGGARQTLRALNRSTLHRQGLLERGTGSPEAAIGRLAGLQAQHANMPYIALWSRLEGLTIAALERALDEHRVVRGTVMRGTLHLVAAADHGAFDVASAQVRLAVYGSIARQAGLDIGDLNRTLRRFCDEPRTVAEMEAHFETVVPDASLHDHVPAGSRHVAFRLAGAGGGLVHVPPSGHWKEHGKPRYIDA